jgi:hypothetical protein
MRRLYGASPLHLLAHLALLPLAGWAVLQVLDQRTATRIVVWLVAAAVVHDFVVLPLYSGADRGVRVLAGGAVNYVRVPAALSLLMLAVFWGTIAERGERTYSAVSGLAFEGYATRWLLVSAALFVVAGGLYLVRSRAGSSS